MASIIEPDTFLARLQQARRLIEGGHVASEAGRQTARLLGRLEGCLSRPLCVAILGEANSGKTTLINRLLGSDLLATDVIQNTRLVVRIRHATAPVIELCRADGSRVPVESSASFAGAGRNAVVEVGLPIGRLAGLEIVDTPGVVMDDPASAQAALKWRAADVAIWCTIGSQAWRASEVQAWQFLGRPAQTSLLVVSRADLLSAADREKVRGRLTAEAGRLFREVILPDGGPQGAGDAIAEGLDRLVREIRHARGTKAAAIVRRQANRLEAPAGRDRRPAMSLAPD